MVRSVSMKVIDNFIDIDQVLIAEMLENCELYYIQYTSVKNND